MGDNAIKYGFRWATAWNGGVGHPSPLRRFVASNAAFTINGGSVASDLNIGDPVTDVNDGSVTFCQGSEAAGGNGNTVWGVVVGVLPFYDATLGRMRPTNKLPSNVVYGTNLERQSQLLVVPATAGAWEVDCDDKATATTLAAYQAFIGENLDHVLTESAATKKLNPRLDISGHGTATAQWRIIGVSGTADNADFAGNYVKLIVVVNESRIPPFSATGI